MQLAPTKQDYHPSGQVVEFYEQDHRYCLRGMPELAFTSATTWISRFFPVFDRDRISLRYAQKHGLSQEAVLALWDENSRIARERGTLVHERAERAVQHFLEQGTLIELDEILTDPSSDGISDDPQLTCALIRSMHEAVGRMSQVLDFLQPERVIASPDLLLSGMVDLVVQLRTDSGRPVIGLYDWKTNQKITRHNPWQNALPPIHHLSDCNFIHYSLQLNLYEFICRREGYFDSDTLFQKVLIHLGPDGYETYKCENLQHVIQLMLEADPERGQIDCVD